MRGCVANFLHGETYSARILVDAFVTAHVSGLADARHERQGPVQRSNDLTERDVAGPSAQDVPAGPPLLALHEAVPLQLEENRLEELLRKSLSDSEFRRLNRPASWLLRKYQERLAARISTSWTAC